MERGSHDGRDAKAKSSRGSSAETRRSLESTSRRIIVLRRETKLVRLRDVPPHKEMQLSDKRMPGQVFTSAFSSLSGERETRGCETS